MIFWLKLLILAFGLEDIDIKKVADIVGGGLIMISRGVLQVGIQLVNPIISLIRKMVCYSTQTSRVITFEESGMMMKSISHIPLFVKKRFRNITGVINVQSLRTVTIEK